MFSYFYDRWNCSKLSFQTRLTALTEVSWVEPAVSLEEEKLHVDVICGAGTLDIREVLILIVGLTKVFESEYHLRFLVLFPGYA